MLLSDPEMESSLLISSDEGATYQKYRLTFYIQSLLFHPKQEDWVLAYSLDQKVNKHCFDLHLVTQVPPGEKRLFTQSKFWKGFNDISSSIWVDFVCSNELSFLLFSIKICRQVHFTYWQCCLSFHRLKMIFSIILLIWPLKQPCEVSRECVFIIICWWL